MSGLAPVQQFNDRLVETQSGAAEVQDFAMKSPYAFPSAEVLVPAPMTVSILGQLTLVATATDFKLVRPVDGFKHVRYPDSFRATIMQLVNAGCLALNQSFANFDEIHKRCGAVRPGVNNIVQLLVGADDAAGPAASAREHDAALQRHLPHQIEALARTVEACLVKARETDRTFNQLLELTMEIHEACTATQGENEGRIKEADLRKVYLAKEQEAAEEMKRIGKEVADRSREDFVNAQKQFSSAVDHMPGAWTIAGLQLVDTFTDITSVVTLGLFKRNQGSSSSSHKKLDKKKDAQPEPPAGMSDVRDPGYQKASMLRNLAELLHTLLTSGDDGRPDWNSIKSSDQGGCTSVRVGFEQVIKGIKPNHPYAGRATSEAVNFSRTGIEYARRLGSVVPPGRAGDIKQLTAEVASWRDAVVAFASEADLKLGTSQTGTHAFLPEQNFAGGGSSAELAVRNAQYRLAVTQAQLNASRESSRAASDKLMEVTGQLGDIMAQIAKVHVQQQNWEEITHILLKAIDFLCELKKYLNNLVHFFDAVHNLVSVTLREAADHFIQIVKDTAAIEDSPSTGKQVQAHSVGGITLDSWARQAIYNHALSTAKISRVVENVSDMYVTLYNGNVHPGVNMLLGMGKLVGSKDPVAIAAAGEEIRIWAEEASNRIVQLVSERMHANERDIQNRMRELERSLGGILPQSSRIEEIVHRAEEARVKEASQEISAAVNENLVFRKKAKANVFV